MINYYYIILGSSNAKYSHNFYALDRNFVVPTLVSIISAVENNAEKLEIHLIIPQSDSGQMKLIEKSYKKEKLNIRYTLFLPV